MNIKNKKKTKIITSTVVGVSSVATALSLGVALTQGNNIANSAESPSLQNARSSVMDNLLPMDSTSVELPSKFCHNQNDQNWQGTPTSTELDSSEYYARSNVDLNVYQDTKIQIAVSVDAKYIDNVNNNLNFYWTFLGNSHAPGILKNNDNLNPDQRNGNGVVLPSDWMSNQLFDTHNGKYTLVSTLNIPKEYAPYFYNQFSKQGISSLNSFAAVKQYFNFVLNTGDAASTSQVFNYQTQSIIRVAVNNLTSKQGISLDQNLPSSTNYVNHHQVELTVKPFNIQGSNGQDLYQYHYQWYKDGHPLADGYNGPTQFKGTQTATLKINNPTKSLNNSQYYCVVSGPYFDTQYNGDDTSKTGYHLINASGIESEVTSATTTLNLLSNFKLTDCHINSASNLSVDAGNSFELSAYTDLNPVYAPYVSYQWYLNNKAIVGQTSDRLTISNFTSTDCGNYYCKAILKFHDQTISLKKSNTVNVSLKNSANSLKVSDTQVKLDGRITLQRHFTTMHQISFSVNTQIKGVKANSENDFSYQWYHDGKVLRGQIYSTLDIGYPSFLDAGEYYCQVTYHTPDGTTLTAQSAPTNISISDPFRISISHNIKDITVVPGESAKFAVKANLYIPYEDQFGNLNGNLLKYQWYCLAPNTISGWIKCTGATKPTLTLNPEQTVAAEGYKFECRITCKQGEPFSDIVEQVHTNPAVIHVQKPEIKVLSQPVVGYAPILGQSYDLYTTAELIGVTNDANLNLGYQWYKSTDKNHQTWTKLVGQTTNHLHFDSLSVSDLDASYKCEIFINNAEDLASYRVMTNPVFLPFNHHNLTIASVNIGSDQRVAVGDSVCLHADSKLSVSDLPKDFHLNYQWFVSNNHKDFEPISNANGPDLDLGVQKATSDLVYKCKVSICDDNNNTISSSDSNVVEVTVYNNASVTINQVNSLDCLQSHSVLISPDVEFSNVDNQKISYQWQVKSDVITGDEWVNIDGQNHLNLNLSSVSLNDNGNQYRLVVTVGDSQFISNHPTTLHVYDHMFTAKTQETALNLKIHQSAAIHVTTIPLVNKDNASEFSYQWYVIHDASQIGADGTLHGQKIEGCTKPVLNLTNPEMDWQGSQFYCAVTYEGDTLNTNLVSLNVENVKLTSDALSYSTIAKNGQAVIKVNNVQPSYDINDAHLVYQFETMAPGANRWHTVTSNGNELDLNNLRFSDNGTVYKCVVKYIADNGTVYATYETNPTVLVVDSEAAQNVKVQLPQNINVKLGSDLNLTSKIQVNGAPLDGQTTYTWEYTTGQKDDDGMLIWHTVDQHENHLLLTNVDNGWNNAKVKLVVSDMDHVYESNEATIRVVDHNFTVNVNQSVIHANIADSAHLAVNVNRLVEPEISYDYSYQWYIIQNGVKTPLKGQTDSELNLNDINATLNRAQYCCVVSDGSDVVESGTITLVVNPNIISVAHNLNPQVITNTSSATLQISQPEVNYNIANAELSYQWMVKNSQSDTWTPVSDCNSNVLNLSNLTVADNNNVYKCVVSYVNSETHEVYSAFTSDTCVLHLNNVINVDINLPSQVNAIVNQSVTLNSHVDIQCLPGSAISYQWQYQDPTTHVWTNVNGGNSQQLTIQVLKQTAVTPFRLVVKVENQTFISNETKLNIFNASYVVNTDSDLLTAQIGGDLTVHASVTQLFDDANVNAQDFKYQWYALDTQNNQILIPQGTQPTLTLHDVDAKWTRAKFYCVVTCNSETQISNLAELKVQDCNLSVNDLASVQVIKHANTTISLSGVAPSYAIKGATLVYQWQKLNANGEWEDVLGANTKDLNLSHLGEKNNGDAYRCHIEYIRNNVVYAQKYTNTTTLVISNDLDVNVSLPSNVNAYLDQNVTLTPKVQILSHNPDLELDVSYQWMVKSADNNSWAKLTNATSKDLSLNHVTTDLSGNQYQLWITIDNDVYKSNIVTLNVSADNFGVVSDQTKLDCRLADTKTLSVKVKELIPGLDNHYRYQWYKVGTNGQTQLIKGATGSSLTLENIKATDAGQYYCVVSCTDQSVNSPVINVNVQPCNIDILSQNLVVNAVNQQVELKIDALHSNYIIGGAKWVYQWEHKVNGEWQNVDHANSAFLKLNDLTADDNGSLYRCVVSYVANDGQEVYASATSEQFIVKVASYLNVDISLPNKMNVCQKSNLTVSPTVNVSAENVNTNNITYQWRISTDTNGSEWTNLEGQTNKQLTWNDINLDTNGKYLDLVLTVNGQQFISNPMQLSVLKSDFAVNLNTNAEELEIGQNLSLTTSVHQIIADQNTAAFTYQWFVVNNGKSVAIHNATSANLELNDVQMDWNNADFYCVVTRNSISQQSGLMHLNIKNNVLTVATNTDQVVAHNCHATLSANTPSVNYQIAGAKFVYDWQQKVNNNWVDLGVNNPTLSLHNLTDQNSGQVYRCVVKYVSETGVVYSQAATNNIVLDVNSIIQTQIKLPTHLNVCVGHDIDLVPHIDLTTDNVDLSRVSYTWRKGNLLPTGEINWTNVDSAKDQHLKLSNLSLADNNSYYQLVMNIDGHEYKSNPVQLSVFDRAFSVNVNNDHVRANIGDSAQLGICVKQSFAQDVTYTYQWFALNPQDLDHPVEIVGANAATLDLTHVSKKYDNAVFYCKVSDGTETYRSPNIHFNVNPCVLTANVDKTTVSAQDSMAMISVNAPDISYPISDAHLVYTWQKQVDGQWISLPNVNASTLALNNLTAANNGEVYRCLVQYISADNNVVYAQTFTTPVTVLVNSELSIHLHLDDQYVTCVHQDLTLKPTVSYQEENYIGKTMSYQWQVGKMDDSGNIVWTNVDTANSFILTLKNLALNSNDTYYRLVLNVDNHSFTSNPAHLKVLSASYSVQAESDVGQVNIGDSVHLSVSVNQLLTNVHEQYSYQWFKKDLATSQVTTIGNNSEQLVLNNVEANDANYAYYCVVSSSDEQVMSNEIHFSVNPVTLNYSPLMSVVHVTHNQAHLTIGQVNPNYEIRGAEISYQWQVLNAHNEWINVDHANSATLDLTHLNSGNDGQVYRCVMSYVNSQTHEVYAQLNSNTTTLEVANNIHVELEIPGVVNVRENGDVTINSQLNLSGENLDDEVIGYQWQKAEMDSKGKILQWSNLPGETQENLNLTHVSADQDNSYYRLIISVGGQHFVSNSAVLNVHHHSFEVNSLTDKLNLNFEIGQTIHLAISANNTFDTNNSHEFSYQWYMVSQSADGKQQTTKISEATQPTLDLTGNEDLDHKSFYCEVTRDGEVINSEVFDLHLIPVTISFHNLNSSFTAEGHKASVSLINAHPNYQIPNTDLTYQWQKQINGQWVDLKGQTTATLTLDAVSYLDNASVYRCVLNYGNYVSVASNVTTLNVKPEFNVDVNLVDQINVCKGDDVTLHPNIQWAGDTNGDVVTYQWQVYANNQSTVHGVWKNLVGENHIELSLKDLTDAMNGNRYRLMMTVDGKTFVSNATKIEVHDYSFVVNTQDTLVKTNLHAPVHLSVTVSKAFNNLDSTPYHFQWYVVDKQSINKNHALHVEGKPIEGATSSMLTIANPTKDHNGEQFYCVVTCGQEVESSPLITLAINECTISAQSLPVNVVSDRGHVSLSEKQVSTSYQIAGDKISYQWQKCSLNADQWVDLADQTSATLDLDNLDLKDNGVAYRCVIHYGDDAEYISNPTTIIVNEALNHNNDSHSNHSGSVDNDNHNSASDNSNNDNNPGDSPVSDDPDNEEVPTDNQSDIVTTTNSVGWIAVPIIFGSLAAVLSGVGVFWYLKRKHKAHR